MSTLEIAGFARAKWVEAKQKRLVFVHADDDPLDWDRLHRDSDTPGVVAGIYTYMEFPLDNHSILVDGYRPHGVTVLSFRAVSKSLGEVGGITSLWPSQEMSAALRIHKDEICQYFEEFELGEDLNEGVDEVEAYNSPSATI